MNMKSVMLVLLACSLFAVVGCSGSDATGDDGTDDDGTGKPSGSSCVSTDDTSGVPTIKIMLR